MSRPRITTHRLVVLVRLVLLCALSACVGRTSPIGRAAGDGEVGDSCNQEADCQRGLLCARGECVSFTGPPESSADVGVDGRDDGDCAGVVGSLSLGDTVVGDTSLLENRWSGSCAVGAAPDAAWRLTLTERTSVYLTTQGSAFDTVLSVLTECHDPATELACNDDAGMGALQSELHLEELAPGEYFIVVDGFQDAAGAYVLTVERSGREDIVAPSDGE